jgi:hypothetical protein
MFDILSHKGNANQNDIKISSETTLNGCHQENKQQMLAGMWEVGQTGTGDHKVK